MLTIDPITPSIGAAVSGLDFSQPIPESVYDEVYQALLLHLVIFIHGVEIGPNEHLAFAQSRQNGRAGTCAAVQHETSEFDPSVDCRWALQLSAFMANSDRSFRLVQLLPRDIDRILKKVDRQPISETLKLPAAEAGR